MLYILLIDPENSMEFWVASCAETYQLTLGGVIYAVDISGSINSATDTVTHTLES
jgi:hypothetical protein